MKLSGTTIVELTTPGPIRLGAGIALGKLSLAVYSTVVVGPFCCCPRSTLRPAALRGIQPLAESVEDVGTKLDRVGTAQLLKREADLERVCESVDRINRRDCDLRRDVERPIDQNAAQALGIIEDLQRPCAARVRADQTRELTGGLIASR